MKYTSYVGDGDSKTYKSIVNIVHLTEISKYARKSVSATFKNKWARGFEIAKRIPKDLAEKEN